jgi:hypothetical protein
MDRFVRYRLPSALPECVRSFLVSRIKLHTAQPIFP